MKFKVISCNVFRHEVEYCAAGCDNRLDIEFIELGEHIHPNRLRNKLQWVIDAVANDPEDYNAILFVYGLCGRATDGITARREPVILPRSHDCGGILLGSRKRFEACFRDMPSTPFSSPGYVENGKYFFQGEMASGEEYQALVAQYGEDNASYVYDAMHPKLDGQLQPVCYIETPELPFPELREQCRKHAADEGREFRILSGSLRLIAMLFSGVWPDDEFLKIEPEQRVVMTADWDRIITCR
ncbi:MAG: DUF1638 domain-containing protein [Victivallales bacterium]|nr:DUF1638 domain-containing protein [Victivallales bacterium]